MNTKKKPTKKKVRNVTKKKSVCPVCKGDGYLELKPVCPTCKGEGVL